MGERLLPLHLHATRPSLHCCHYSPWNTAQLLLQVLSSGFLLVVQRQCTNELSSKQRFAWLSGLMAKLLQIRLVLYCRPHLNFISGENGSGKSAALQCLQVCLGVQARLTGRAKTGKELINDNATVATAQVVLWNTVGILPSYPYAAHPSVRNEEHFLPYASCALNQPALSAVQHCILLSAY